MRLRLNVGRIVALVRHAWSASVIRTVWLGLVLFFGLAGLASYKLAFGAPPPRAVVQTSAVTANRDMPEVGTGPVMDTLTKSDRLPVTSISSVEPLATELQMPEELPSVAVPKVINRHRKGSDLKAERVGPKRSSQTMLRSMSGASKGSRHSRPATRRRAHSSGSSAQPRSATTE